ncbi:MAG: tripartite tricarboxylate transporter TctB family protein [Burkholderiales bacterium]
MKIKSPTNFWSGVMFAVIGFTFALIAYGLKIGDMVLLAGYTMGTPARMGPAFFPFWLGVILTGIGVVIALEGFKFEGKPVDKFHWGPIGWVLGAVILFGILMKPLGMPLAGLVLVFVASLGSHDFHWKPVLILAVALVIFSTLVFVYGLKLPIPLCPDVETLQEMRVCRV